jgi:epoxyqueuosine reductase
MNKNRCSAEIKSKALSLGASAAGIASVKAVLKTPSHRKDAKVHRRFKDGVFLVLTLEHTPDNPSLDWWGGRGGTAGNRELLRICRLLQNWIKKTGSIHSRILSYHVEKEGIYLKEAAVAAGLGCIGRNNLLITPQHGANVRLKAMLLESDLAVDGPAEFDPCEHCPAPCLTACPQNAFQSGAYDRKACAIQMRKDEANRQPVLHGGEQNAIVSYCRACEWACPNPMP